MNKTTIELLQELNTMQKNHIKILQLRLEMLSKHKKHLNETISNQAHTIEIDKITIKTQEKTINLYIDNLNNKSNV